MFRHSWLTVAHASQLSAPGSYAAGSLLGLQWVACRDEQGQLRAFHNVRKALGGASSRWE